MNAPIDITGVTLKTERLTLRGIDGTDAAAIVLWRGDPAVYRYFLSPHKITEEEHLRWYRERYLPDEGRCDWMCLRQSDGARIGVFGLIRDGDAVEVSYLLAPEARGRGYAQEAVLALLCYAKTEWGAHKATAEIHRDNAPSLALAKRLGFTEAAWRDDFILFEKEV